MGSAKNGFGLLGLFDKTYYLSANNQLIMDRLRRRADNGDARHDDGKTCEQRMVIVRKIGQKREEARGSFEFMVASLTLGEICDMIVKK